MHPVCQSKLDEVLCEVCGKPVDIYKDYLESLGDKLLNPQEYLDHINNLSDEEREQRRVLFKSLFEEHGFQGEVRV